MNNQKIKECKGSGKIKFGDLKDLSFKKPGVKAASTFIKPSTSSNYDSDASGVEDDIVNFSNYKSEEIVTFGFSQNSAEVTTKIPITKETIPSYTEMEKTASIADKYCIICLKSKMNLDRLVKHLDSYHYLFFKYNCTLEEWLEAEEEWQYSIKNDPALANTADNPSSDEEAAPSSNENCIVEQHSSSDEKVKKGVNN